MKEESKFKLMGYTTFLWTVPITPGNGGKSNAFATAKEDNASDIGSFTLYDGMVNFDWDPRLKILPGSSSNDFG